MVKTQWRCLTLMSKRHTGRAFHAYLLPQEGQKRLWHRKETNLKFSQCGQSYKAPPK